MREIDRGANRLTRRRLLGMVGIGAGAAILAACAPAATAPSATIAATQAAATAAAATATAAPTAPATPVPTPQPTPSNIAPSPRSGHVMAFDSKRGVIVLFGGHSRGAFVSDTWERRATTWTQRTPPISPPARTGAALAYDSVRGVTVLFGGQSAGGGFGLDSTFLADTWEWDGTIWTQRTSAVSPGARYFAAVTFDERRRAVLLFGGSDRGRTAFDETWEWDGTIWTKYPASASPSPRADVPMAYEPASFVSGLSGGVLVY